MVSSFFFERNKIALQYKEILVKKAKERQAEAGERYGRGKNSLPSNEGKAIDKHKTSVDGELGKIADTNESYILCKEDFQKVELALRFKPMFQKEAKERQGERNDLTLVENTTEVKKPKRTDEKVGELAGVGKDTVRKVETILEKGTEQVELF